MCVDHGGPALKPRPKKEIAMKRSKPASDASADGKNSVAAIKPTGAEKAAAHSVKKTLGKTKEAAKPANSVQRPRRSGSGSGRLVCRYCGSNDLAPSFIKRRDARCRACFNRRYRVASGKGATPSAA
jgi:hypothetical protein